MMPVLPYVALTWAAPTPPGGISFARYHLYRDGARLVLPAAQVATLGNIATLAYADYLASPSVAHMYEVAWVGEQDGIEVESARESATATLAFPAPGGWLHDVNDPGEAVHVLARSIRLVPRMEQRWQRPRNRRAETLYSGRLFAHDLQVQLIAEAMSDTEMWDALHTMADAQTTTDTIYCLRMGFRPGERYFVQIADPEQGLARALSEASLALREAHFGEVA